MVYHVYPDPDCSEQGPCNLKIDVSWKESEWKKDEKGKEEGAAKTEQWQKRKTGLISSPKQQRRMIA